MSDINNEFIQKIKYYGKRKNKKTGEWEITTKIDMSPEYEIEHREATHCYLCGKKFLCPPYCQGCDHCYHLGGKVKDHDHLLKKNNDRGAAHYKCNINSRQDQFRVPVLAHNAFRFDFQLILNELFQIPDLNWVGEIAETSASLDWDWEVLHAWVLAEEIVAVLLEEEATSAEMEEETQREAEPVRWSLLNELDRSLDDLRFISKKQGLYAKIFLKEESNVRLRLPGQKNRPSNRGYG